MVVFDFHACIHDTLNSAVEVVPILLWSSNFDSSIQKEKKIFNYDSCFAMRFNNSENHGTNSSSGDYDSALSIFLPLFFKSVCTPIWDFLQLEDT